MITPGSHLRYFLCWRLKLLINVFRSNSELFDQFEVLFDDILLDKIIGQGAFGKVYRGRLLKQTMEAGKGRKSSKRKTDKEQQQMKRSPTVAVKMLKSMIWLCQRVISFKGALRLKSVNGTRHTKIVIASNSFMVGLKLPSAIEIYKRWSDTRG